MGSTQYTDCLLTNTAQQNIRTQYFVLMFSSYHEPEEVGVRNIVHVSGRAGKSALKNGLFMDEISPFTNTHVTSGVRISKT